MQSESDDQRIAKRRTGVAPVSVFLEFMRRLAPPVEAWKTAQAGAASSRRQARRLSYCKDSVRMVGTSRCDVPARVQRAESAARKRALLQMVAPLHAARTAQRAVPTTALNGQGPNAPPQPAGTVAVFGRETLHLVLTRTIGELFMSGLESESSMFPRAALACFGDILVTIQNCAVSAKLKYGCRASVLPAFKRGSENSSSACQCEPTDAVTPTPVPHSDVLPGRPSGSSRSTRA